MKFLLANLKYSKKIHATPKAYHLTYEDISFYSKKENLLLKGWWLLSQSADSEKVIIFVHGFGGNRTYNPHSTLDIAKIFVENGYHVLMFDLRNSGESKGRKSTMGLNETDDLLGAIHYAKYIKKMKFIGVLGWSMGATTALLTSSSTKDINVIIADSPFSTFTSYLKKNLHVWAKTPLFLNSFLFFLYANTRFYNYKKINVFEHKKALETTPLLLIHSKYDNLIPYQESLSIFEKFNEIGKTEFWIPENPYHVSTHIYLKEEYGKIVLNFLNKHQTSG